MEVGVKVISLTCDGPSCHFSMLSELGVNLNPYNLTSFPHPHNSGASNRQSQLNVVVPNLEFPLQSNILY